MRSAKWRALELDLSGLHAGNTIPGTIEGDAIFNKPLNGDQRVVFPIGVDDAGLLTVVDEELR